MSDKQNDNLLVQDCVGPMILHKRYLENLEKHLVCHEGNKCDVNMVNNGVIIEDKFYSDVL
jgi:hypothetical protein